MTAHHDDNYHASAGKAALLGFGAALVWLLIVGAISFFWAWNG